MTSPNNPGIEPNFEGEEMHMPDGAKQMTTEPSGSPVLSGVIITLLFLILIALLGGLYYWSTLPEPTPAPTSTRPTAAENQEPESTTARARTEALDVVSTSDELSAIEADLLSTNLDELDTDLNAIEAEFTAALESN